MKGREWTWRRVFLAGICAAVLLVGCGEEETVHTGADAQTEETQEKESAEENDSADPEAVDRLKEQTSASRAQMEIDEETRRELTAQILEEEDLDTSVIDSKRKTKGCTFDIPEGFAQSEEKADMYVTKRYPIDASAIYYVAMEEDISQQLLTGETFQEQMEEDLKQAYGEEVEVAVDSFERERVSGYPAFRILCHYEVSGVKITQLAYAINADKSYMITYSQTSDYDYMEAYEASAATIQVE